ncbi:MAG TPA: glycosyltransferase family 4 protein [Lacunisphaera sp.]|nr:glycosyltransferase family 4 protein [Lacunisphaera sp.]
MDETDHPFFHLDQPAAPAMAGETPLTVKGWARGKQGRHLVDLRIRIGDRIEPVAYGFPRADLARLFGAREHFLPVGFEATMPCPAGPALLEFEGCDIGGQWRTVGTLELGPGGPSPAPALDKVSAVDFGRALQFVLRNATAVPLPAAAANIAGWLPAPPFFRFRHQPFRSHLHQPGLLERSLFGRMRLEGWLFHESAAIRRVTASIDLHTWQELSYGEDTAHVAAAFPQFPPATRCGVSGLVDIPAQLPRPASLRLYVELEDGSWHLCHVQRVHPWTYEEEKAPQVPPSLRGFVRSGLALRAALQARGFAVPFSRALWTELASTWRHHRRGRRGGAAVVPLPVPRPAPVASGLRVTLVTHNLGYEGAPLFLFELARHLAAGGARLQVCSAAPGPLAAAFAGLGAAVRIVDIAPLGRAADARALRAALRQLSPQVDLADTDLVVANTLSAFWGVHLARVAARPSLFYIHESTTPANFYLGHMAPETLPVIEETFHLATYVSFLTEATRAYYRPYLGADNHGINPGWVDLQAIDRHLAARSREEARRRLGIDQATRLVINVGAVCDRKGQHIFARGVDLMWRQAPAQAAACRFLMVGGRDTLFDRHMEQLLVQLDRANLQVIPITATPVDYYGAADLFVCSSYEESFPRVLMEAMVCHLPILTTNVHGIPDMISHEQEGWFIPPGNSQAVSEGMQHLLAHPELMHAMAERADARARAIFGAHVLLPRHAALATRIATGGAASPT